MPVTRWRREARLRCRWIWSAAPGSDLIIPLVATNENGASDSDYSGVPASLTFTAEDTEKTFTFAATQDADDDDGERVRLTFGTLPAGVNADANKDAAAVHITDDDVPSVVVSFGQDSLHGGGGRHGHGGGGAGRGAGA